jgi:hypothetical protein
VHFFVSSASITSPPALIIEESLGHRLAVEGLPQGAKAKRKKRRLRKMPTL